MYAIKYIIYQFGYICFNYNNMNNKYVVRFLKTTINPIIILTFLTTSIK